MITIPLQIRPSDQDSLGHVNNAAYVAYVQLAVAELLARNGFAADWHDDSSPHHWMMGELAIEYRLPSAYGDHLSALVWLAEADEQRPLFGCQLFHSDLGQEEVAVRSRSRWQRRASSTGEAVSLPQAFLETAVQEGAEVPRPFSAPAETRAVRRYEWRHSVQRSEVGPGGRVHPHVFFEWIEEGILGASSEAGWPIERCLAQNFVVFQMRHDANLFSMPLLGETVEIASRLVDVRRLRGTWHNEIRSLADGRLLAENYSTGVFLNLDGRPTSPPPGMMEALQQPGA
jgi:YbgC/YbaW family acyl-CoA thioester hydrolase